MRKYSPANFANFLCFCNLLRAEICTTFEPKVVQTSARNPNYTKFAKFEVPYLPHFTTFCDQILPFYQFEDALSSYMVMDFVLHVQMKISSI